MTELNILVKLKIDDNLDEQDVMDKLADIIDKHYQNDEKVDYVDAEILDNKTFELGE